MIFSERRSHVPGGGRRIETYRQTAILPATAALQIPKGRLGVLENPARKLDEFLPDRKMSPAVCTFKQRCASSIFEDANSSAQRRLTDT
jgi:hypothetical protein